MTSYSQNKKRDRTKIATKMNLKGTVNFSSKVFSCKQQYNHTSEG